MKRPHIVDSALARELKASLIAAGAAQPVGTTWAHFREAMQSLGVKDGDRIAYIEFGVRQLGSGYIVADDTDTGWEIREL